MTTTSAQRSLIASMLVAAVLVVLPGAATAARETTDPLLGAPVRGECFQLGIKAAQNPSTRLNRRDCAQSHTAWAIGVTEAPDDVRVVPGGGRLRAFALQFCYESRGLVIGPKDRAYASSAYTTFYFIPNASLREQGARWVACLASIRNGAGLLANTVADPPRVSIPNPDPIAGCLDSQRRVLPCALPHEWRGIPSKRSRGSMTQARAQKQADRHCPALTGADVDDLYLILRVRRATYVLVCFDRTTA